MKYIVKEPVIDLCLDGKMVSQAIYGHLVEMVDEGSCLIQTSDGYRGCVERKSLVEDDVRWRTSLDIHLVKSQAAHLYKKPDIKERVFMCLPWGAKVEVKEEGRQWNKVLLVTGEEVWIQSGDIEKPRVRTLQEIMEEKRLFLERPYLWGGTSSFGFDCSGLVQTLVKQMGVLLPRDSDPQSKASLCKEVDTMEKGDLLFFGKERVSHVALYAGEGVFFHVGEEDLSPKVGFSHLERTNYQFLKGMRVTEPLFEANVFPFKQELQLIKMNHWGFDYCVHQGELVVNTKIVDEVIEIFEELFSHRYPIEKMRLIDHYGGDDPKSCADNNTSAYCDRAITGSSQKSMHSYGLAIDINPLLNPYKKGDVIVPIEGEMFLDRSLNCMGMLFEEDPCCQAFLTRGWEWGGHWPKTRGYLDTHHFHKSIESLRQ